ncbi:MAG: FHA domain-containing protein [Coleofasciculus sp. G3-WIS-01]|uniref:FHA domain-containing protein n=1 Tax=Coleofasciculus sp. G3-WIS-01 TaxID=3069528 RepID=UPI0032FF67F9
MIVCPNCNHQNPDGATQCEACYTPLPATMSCPNCGTTVQTDASFCGQCGFNLKASGSTGSPATSAPMSAPDVPDLDPPDPLIEPEPLSMSSQSLTPDPPPDPGIELPATLVSQPGTTTEEKTTLPEEQTAPPPPPVATPTPGSAKTQLQVQSVYLLHLQTQSKIELPSHIRVIHIGKPNDQIPPDVDVSGFPNSEIVSRVHADIRVEGDIYYLEDVGSANGTYVNHTPLPSGDRHRLRTGDRISLGKGDLVTFLFQVS